MTRRDPAAPVNAVKPRMSVNITVPTWRLPPEAEVVVGPLEHVVHHVPGDEPREDPAQALCSRSCSRFFVRPARR